MQKYSPLIIRIIVTVYLVFVIGALSMSPVLAQTSSAISGDKLCGATASNTCDFSHVKTLVKGSVYLVIGLGFLIMIVIISSHFVIAWFAAAEGRENVYREAAKRAGNAILGFIIIVALVGGALTALLKFLGAADPVTRLLELVTQGLIPTAYAQVTMIPTATADTDVYDFLLKMLAMVMRFFVYPGLIIAWVLTGFSFVLAQGKPESLAKAKKLIVWATVSTLVVVMIQGFLMAARGTVEKILPGSGSLQEEQQPAVSQQSDAASKCASGGGTLASDGVTCTSGVSRAGSGASDFCNGKPTGTLCALSGSSSTGICKRDTVVGCFRPSRGEECISPSGKIGTIDTSGNCFTRPSGVDSGGSCRINGECLSDTCYESVCYNVGEQCTKKNGSYGRITIARDCQ